MIDSPISADDITLYALNGLGSEFRDIAALIRNRESSLTFEELHDMLVSHESYLKHIEASNSITLATANNTQRRPVHSKFHRNQRSNNGFSGQNRTNHNQHSRREWFGKPQIICQLCDKVGHSAKTCRVVSSNKSVNCASSSGTKDKKWLMDSATSHNITSDLVNLSIHSEYDGTDQVVIGDGSGLQVTHVGSMTLPSASKSFKLTDILCVPNIHQNLISVHNFTRSNNVSMEFHPFYFLVKDRSMGATILRGKCQDGVYPMPMPSAAIQSSTLAFVGE